MNKNVAAFLRVDHAQLTNFRPIVPRNVKQSSVADLSAHLGIERRSIENDIYFLRFFAWQNGFDNCFRLEKIVSKKFGRLAFRSPSSTADFLLLLCLARTLTLFVHQFLEILTSTVSPRSRAISSVDRVENRMYRRV